MFFKKKVKEDWIAYIDEIADKPLSVRVNRAKKGEKYKHTLYVIVHYDYSEQTPFPDKEFLNNVASIEDMVDAKIQGSDVEFIGSATFGGNVNLIYVTNKDIDWNTLLDMDQYERLSVGKYPNDNMGYFKNILYPG